MQLPGNPEAGGEFHSLVVCSLPRAEPCEAYVSPQDTRSTTLVGVAMHLGRLMPSSGRFLIALVRLVSIIEEYIYYSYQPKT